MARPRTQRSPDSTDAIGAAHIDGAALDRAGSEAAEHAQHIAVIEQTYGMDLPYQLDIYVAAIRQRAAESAMRLIEIGRLLILIREREPTPVYMSALERCGITPRFAQRAIQTAVKLADRAEIQALGVSKALELLSEDDDALDALADGGTVAGLTLDDIDRMPVSELRKTLRTERAERAEEKATDEDIIRRKDERINKLTREHRRVARSSAREQVADLLTSLDTVAVEVSTQIKLLRDTASAIRAAYAEAGEALDEEVAARIEQNAQLAQQWAAGLAEELAE